MVGTGKRTGLLQKEVVQSKHTTNWTLKADTYKSLVGEHKLQNWKNVEISEQTTASRKQRKVIASFNSEYMN